MFHRDTRLEAYSQSSLHSLSEDLPGSPLGSLLGIPFIKSLGESLANLQGVSQRVLIDLLNKFLESPRESQRVPEGVSQGSLEGIVPEDFLEGPQRHSLFEGSLDDSLRDSFRRFFKRPQLTLQEVLAILKTLSKDSLRNSVGGSLGTHKETL